jgi:formylglycine-generating enzyme required for sulfatase activity
VKAVAPYLPYLCIAVLLVGGIGLGVYKWASPEPPTVVIESGHGGKIAVLPAGETPVASQSPSPTPSVPSPSPVATAKPSPPPVLTTPALTPAPNTGPAPTATPTAPGLSGAPNVIGSLPPNLPLSSATAGREPASIDRPYVNTLGMRFVPVKIDEGPVERQVLFSVWDTRVQDFEAFEKAKKLRPFHAHGKEPIYPIVNVTWDQAKAFCAWLTEKEHRDGKIGPNEAYRLPTDLEWSWAVGLEESDAERGGRALKSGNNENVYPWGPVYPPLPGAGNYAQRVGVDDYNTTSPVGSFAPNRNGLYDMGGNVWQWCEDAYKARMNSPEAITTYTHLKEETTGDGTPYRVLRGASWVDGGEVILRSAFRENGHPEHGLNNVGFRCVLEGSGG